MAGSRTVRLAEVVDLATGFPFKSDGYVDDPASPRLVRGDNVVQGTIRWENAKRWPRDATEGLERYELAPGDVVVAMDRPWIEAGLKYASVGTADLPAYLVQRVARLRGVNGLDTSYLRYVIGSRDFTRHVLSIQTGTAVPHISASQILEYELELPTLDEQRRIAHILGTLDDKIDLNRRMNETLEEMARALFKSWFVDFDPVRAKAEGRDTGLPKRVADLFPDRLVDSELGEIPHGWDVVALDEMADFRNGLALQKYPHSSGPGLPVIKIAQLRKGGVEGADLANTDVPNDYVVEDGDLLFSWSGSLECEIWAGGRGALNQHLFKVTSSKYPPEFMLMVIRHHLDRFRGIAADKATTMGHIKRGHLSEARLGLPSHATLAEFTGYLSAPVRMSHVRRLESRELLIMRDALLLDLMRDPEPRSFRAVGNEAVA